MLLFLFVVSFWLSYQKQFILSIEYDDYESEENPFQPRIAGGRHVHVGEIPYQMQIRYMDDYICGGALVIAPSGNQIVITAGQCVTKSSPHTGLLDAKLLSVVGGRVRLNGVHLYEQYRSVVKFHRHEKWKRTYSLYYYDIAILHLSSPFRLNRLVQPIDLPYRKKIIGGPDVIYRPDGDVIISGWGYDRAAEAKFAETLQVGTVRMVELQKCRNEYSTLITAKIGEYNFCAGTPGNPDYQGGCIGDNGSPAVAVHNDSLYLAGTFNWGQPKCGNRYQPSIFTDMAYFQDWIEKKSKP